jgi:hypothetical protein
VVAGNRPAPSFLTLGGLRLTWKGILRLKEHIAHASDNGVLDEVARFLRELSRDE